MEKKLILVFTFCFMFVGLAFSSNMITPSNEASAEQQSSYEIIRCFVGDVSEWQEFEVCYSGTYIGCSATFRLVSSSGSCIRFICPIMVEPGQNVVIGNFLVQQNGRRVSYEVYANVK